MEPLELGAVGLGLLLRWVRGPGFLCVPGPYEDEWGRTLPWAKLHVAHISCVSEVIQGYPWQKKYTQRKTSSFVRW